MLAVLELALSYPRGDKPLFSGLCFNAGPGELILLRGPNGSGKTSLLNAISGVIPQRVKAELEGDIHLGETDLISLPLNERFRHLAYQMANPDHQLFFPRVSRELSFSLENMGLPVEEIRARSAAAAQAFGLAGFLEREPATLSRGEKKLLVLATCAALKPALYLLDEPSAALDANSRKLMLAWLKSELERGAIAVVAEHDSGFEALATQTLRFPI